MTYASLFSACNLFAMAGWLLLIVAPRWVVTRRLVLSGLWSVALSVLYAVLIVSHMPGAEGGFGSIEEVRTFFSSDVLLLAGWVHYLAFDLFLGAVMARQWAASAHPHLLLIPILALTFFLGPIGLVGYVVIRSILERRAAPALP